MHTRGHLALPVRVEHGALSVMFLAYSALAEEQASSDNSHPCMGEA